MDTKRCAYCHKLVRADANICSGCGQSFVLKKSGPSFVGVTQPTLPTASPHRAGHYSGLHPEDQPYQSSMMAIQRPTKPNVDSRRLPSQEPAGILLPEVHIPSRLSSSRRITPPPDLDALPLLIERMLSSLQRRKPFLSQERATPILLILSCIFFLLASSILAFTLLGQQSAAPISTAKLVAGPDVLRVNDLFFLRGTNFGPNNTIIFTYDVGKPLLNGGQEQLAARANDKGFFQVQMRVPNTWGAGVHIIYATDEAQRLSTSAEITVQSSSSAPPYLQLSTSTLNLGSDRAGTVTSGTVTLINKGGGQVIWQATSDATWLTATPNGNTFAGSQLVTVQVNRSSLAPETYTGHISFAQKTGAAPLTLTVTMAVKPTAAALNISTRGAIAFSVDANQGTSPQTITLQNSSGEPLDWSGKVSTGDGSPWLFISPTSGRINPNTSQLVTVDVQPQQLPPGSYTGMIAFTGGASAQVDVMLNVLAPGSLSVSLTSLSFTTIAGLSPNGKTVTLQNIGGQPLNWAASTGTANWLSVVPASGSLDPGEQASVRVNVNGGPLTPGSYQGIITFSGGSPAPQVEVVLTVNVPPTPTINVQGTPLNFTAYKGINPTPQTFTVANTGNATLNWIVSEDGNGTTFAPVTPTSGQISPGRSVSLTVSPHVLGYSPGMLTTVITVADSDSGTKVPSQKIVVSITILDQANITLSDNALSFTNASTTPATSQLLTITNSGSADLNWKVTLNETAATTISWLSVDVSSGTLALGTNSVINVHCNSSQLSPGTYTATLTVGDSDPGTPVAPQIVQITLEVQ